MDVNDIYEYAMDLAEQASELEKVGRHQESQHLLRQALDQVLIAVGEVRQKRELEPSRSLILFSAANLAFETDQLLLAEKLTFEALSGEPPPNVEHDLRILLDEARMYRNLQRDALQLVPGELNIGLEGDAILKDYIAMDEFFRRVNAAKRIYRRTLERLREIPFDDRSSTPAPVRSLSRTFMSLTQPGSYRVTLRFGTQPQFRGLSEAQSAIDELVDCVELLQDGGERALAERITNDSYRINFIGLVKTLAPDGKRVSTVSLTTQRTDRSRTLLIRSDLKRNSTLSKQYRGIDQEIQVFQGRLNIAVDRSERSRLIGLTDSSGRQHSIFVPTGLMRDIVRPYFDDTVEIVAAYDGQRWVMQEISLVNTDEDGDKEF